MTYQRPLVRFLYFSTLILSFTACTKRGGSNLQTGPNPSSTPTPTPSAQVQPFNLPDRLSIGGPTSMMVGECKPYTVNTYHGNSLATVLADTLVDLSQNGSAQFYKDFSCTQSTTQITVLNGADSALFYVKPALGEALTLYASSPALGNISFNVAVIGASSLTISPSSFFDFGWKQVGSTNSQSFILANMGTGSLTGIASPIVTGSSFAFLGGAFPGTGGNCSNTLGINASCTIVVSFIPVLVGNVTGSLLFEYVDGLGSHSALVSLQGKGTVPAALDASFNSTGKVFTAINGGTDEIRSLNSFSDGKLLAVGNASFSGSYRVALAKYLSSGALDTSFGSGGITTHTFGGSSSYPFSSALQDDGKAVVVGYQFKSSKYDSAIVRFNLNGSLDTGFGTSGQNIVAVATGYDILTGVALQTDGKAVACGYTQNATFDFSLLRFTTNGQLDTSFGTGGIVRTSLGTGSDMSNALVVQADGKIVVAGTSVNTAGNYDFGVARYLSNGNLDTSFGTAGKMKADFFVNADGANTVKAQSDGKILLAGNATQGTQNLFAIIRLNSNGTLDSSFHTDGRLTASFSETEDMRAMVLQNDGKILVGGSSYINPKYNFSIVRLLSNGAFDTTFGTNGQFNSVLTTGADKLYTMVLHPDGRIVAGGGSYNGTSTQFALARYFP